MGMNVANCPRCGKIFVKGFAEVCPNCVKDLELQYEKCLKYLRENKGTTINDLSEATAVSIKQITKFIREGRISILHAPNMSYPCEVCGISIRENTICESCRSKLVKDVKNNAEDERRRAGLADKEAKVSFKIQERLKDRH
ncbi:TIGR03826 family flagellar region protein [Paenibacillus sp. GCM10023248]|uniref:TIGR03826 family flagellar region protein n=1 Tax=unclassified Paenibacillus TaxID=185978 RepID=UPI0023790212|nr:TIGR03826 family flagellar region protein [Paenibacillus sp. MAHUQ-63]MDD9271795.1 flagellar protein [Paenibacillus sp. MAHUQ-63]